MQRHANIETVAGLLEEMIGWFLGAGKAGDAGYRHLRGTDGARREPVTTASTLPTVTVEADAVYFRARSTAKPKRFGRQHIAANLIVDAEVIENEPHTSLTR